MGERRRRRRRVEPTDEWEQIELLCAWPEQRDYELIRPLVLFGSPAAGRAEETGAASGRTLQRRAKRFDAEGMDGLFDSEAARRRGLPPSVRRLIVDLKAEYPGFNPNEIANACYVRFGRKPARKTVKRVLAEEPAPLRMMRRFPPYHEIGEPAERRLSEDPRGPNVRELRCVQRRLLPHEVRALIADYEAGRRIGELARIHGIHRTTVSAPVARGRQEAGRLAATRRRRRSCQAPE